MTTQTQAKIIFPDSPEAAVYEARELTGWWSSNGRFYGQAEDLARAAGATHRRCECGAVFRCGTYTICPECFAKKTREHYAALERREYAGEPLAEYNGDHFFWDWDALIEAAECGDISEGVMLVIAEPCYGNDLDPDDYLCDAMPADDAIELSQAVHDAAKAFNDAVRAEGPLSYCAGRIVPTLTPDQHAELARAFKEAQ